MATTKLDELDHGYAWIILGASFFNLMLIIGTLRSFGIIYAELLETYHVGAGYTAIILSIVIFLVAVGAPVSGLISTSFSFKWCTVIGGILAGLGMVASAFTNRVEMLFLTYGVILGTGCGLALTPTLTIINFYFEKKRGLANGILWSASGISIIVNPTMYRQLIDKYGIHGAMIIVGGILLNICVGASLFRQPKCFRRQTAVRLLTNNDTKGRNPKLSIRKKLIEMFNAYRFLMNNPTFLIYCTAISFAFASNVLMFIILPPHMLHEHFTKQDVIIVLIVVGGVELIARFVAGKLLDLGYFTVQTLFVVNMFVGGICSIIFPFFRHMGINIAYSVIFAVFPGVTQIATPMLIVSILGFKALSTAYPLSHMIIHFVILIVSPLLGWFNDLTGSWSVSFYTIGGLQILSSVIIFIERLLWKLKQKTDPVGIGQMEHTKTTETSLLEENIPMMDHNIK